jgi:hypothetical protein
MRTYCKELIIVGLISTCTSVFAQSPSPVSRTEVRDQLIQLEQAGYEPAQIDPSYPSNLQAAEARVAARESMAATESAYGPVTNGSSHSGAPNH